MTQAEKVLEAMRNGCATLDELRTATGFNKVAMNNALSELRSRGLIRSVPLKYRLTPTGKDYTPKEKAARKAANASLTMVAKSVKTNPNSVFALGSFQGAQA